MSYLVSLLERDGVRFKDKSGSEWQTHCFLPTHGGPDKNPSMSVDVTKGVYYCHKCGLGGNSYKYLTEVRNMSSAAAMKMMEEDGQVKPKGVKPSKDKFHLDEIPVSNRGLKSKLEYDYRNEQGRLVMRVIRYSGIIDGQPQKKFMQLTPAMDGGWYMCKATNQEKLPKDVSVEKLPLYRLAELERPGDVWFVEGEKCVDAVNDIESPFKQQPIAVCIAGGSSAKLADNDFSPLQSRNVIVVADADNAGRKFAARIGRMLYIDYKCNIKYVMPDGGDGYDIADALHEGGWESAMAWIKQSKRYAHPLPKDLFEEQKVETPNIDEAMQEGLNESYGENFGNRETVLENNRYFRVMGYTAGGEHIAIYWKENNTVLFFRPSAFGHTGTLLQVAPIEFWESLTKSKALNNNEKLLLQDLIYRVAEKKDIIRSVDQLGRGAIMQNDKLYYNLGDRFLADEDKETGMLSKTYGLEEAPNRLVLEPGEVIILDDDITKFEQYSTEFYEAFIRYRFESVNDARIMAGWMVSTIIGGALEHRPHVWLSAPARTGKTYLLNKVIKPFLGNMVQLHIDSTYAGIAQDVRSDSIGVIIDEFEPEEHKESQMREILAMLRGASGGEASRTRGSSEGRANKTRPRFSALLSSVNKPSLSEADESRLANCYLSRRPVPNWDAVRKELTRVTSQERLCVIRSATIKHLPALMDMVGVMMGELENKDGVDSRSAMMHAALTAGACWLSGDETLTFNDNEVLADRSFEMLQMILSSNISMNDGGHRIDDMIGKMIAQIHNEPAGEHQFVRNILHSYGIKWWEDRYSKETVLLIAKEMPAMQKLIRNSPVANLKIASVMNSLKQIEGVYEPLSKNGGYVLSTFGSVRKAAVAIPIDVLEKAGLRLTKGGYSDYDGDE